MKKGFDGYYVKCVDNDFVVAVIFGKNANKRERSSFIQIITKDKAFWFGFGYGDFTVNRKSFCVSIGNNKVDCDGMKLNLDDGNVKIKCDLKFSTFSKIKYDAMGPFRFLPFMECRHRVVSMNHRITGIFQIDEHEHIYNEADGYIEGDSGKSFPSKYLWTQCNSFTEHPNISVVAMCARIPYMGIRFRGKICIIHIDGREYRLATYRGARVRAFAKDKLVVRQGWGRRRMLLEITAQNPDENMNELFAPIRGKMSRKIKESIIINVHYKFTMGKGKNEKIIFDITSDNAAFEFG
ncbi:MAG: hypothetical protein FWE16_03370 [Firmicutes bacterium]|nr:hypothetical protein [Bacillota bacterium]